MVTFHKTISQLDIALMQFTYLILISPVLLVFIYMFVCVFSSMQFYHLSSFIYSSPKLRFKTVPSQGSLVLIFYKSYPLPTTVPNPYGVLHIYHSNYLGIYIHIHKYIKNIYMKCILYIHIPKYINM